MKRLLALLCLAVLSVTLLTAEESKTGANPAKSDIERSRAIVKKGQPIGAISYTIPIE